MIVLSGIPVYRGIEAAPAHLHQQALLRYKKAKIEPELINNELDRFEGIQRTVLQELVQYRDKAEASGQPEELDIFNAHLIMAEDPALIDGIKARIRDGLLCAEQAIEETKKEIVEMFLSIEDEYLSSRAADVEDVTNRFMEIALGIAPRDFSNIKEPVILVAKDLKPSELSQLGGFIKGILLEHGSQTSHTAIMAKAKGIPTVVGVTGIYDMVQSGDLIILDSISNKILIKPAKEELRLYQTRKEILEQKRERDSLLKDEEAITKDGRRIKLYGNIGSSPEAALVKYHGGRGIGLFRTEFLFMNSAHFPTEEEQFKEYKNTVEQGFEEVVIRTLDIGGDKNLPYYQFRKEENPFLGLRAIRFSLARPGIFKTQLRAILRASAFGKVSLLLPMISSLEEVLKAKELLEECKNELRRDGISFDSDIRTGIMIEIPAAVIISDHLIEEVDFFSIGTNDLCQYSLAVDRVNKEVTYLYQPLHPGMLRLIRQSIDASHKNGKESVICGEMAGDPMNVLVLVGLGVDGLSMSPAVIPEIKALIRQLSYEETKQLADRIMVCKNTGEIKAALELEIQKLNA